MTARTRPPKTKPRRHGRLFSASLLGVALTGTISCGGGGSTALHLHDNSLTGPIPPEIGDPMNLKYLYVNDNLLIDQLPNSFLSLPLDAFWWSNNASLCAPDNGGFWTWFEAIEDHRPGPFCSGAPETEWTTWARPPEAGPTGAMPESDPVRGVLSQRFDRREPADRPGR